MGLPTAYIVAARRTVLGRAGGLHRSRRVDDLAAPVITAALADARVSVNDIDGIVLGNCRAGDNPARLVALAAGLSDGISATTIDQQCASGLEAILTAARRVRLGEASIVVAGGAEAISTAPWRIARPRALHQTPYFIGHGSAEGDDVIGAGGIAALEALAAARCITRADQDAWALETHVRAHAAQRERRFVGEIVPLKATVEESRDQTTRDLDVDCLTAYEPLAGPDGTLTAANTSALHDGAALVVVMGEKAWLDRGKPPALRLMGSAALGLSPERQVEAATAALGRLFDGQALGAVRSLSSVEMSEAAAVQAITLIEDLKLDRAIVNPDGGAIARGHPLAAAGAVLMVRLFTRLVRNERAEVGWRGAATVSAHGGLGLAVLVERV